MPIAWSVGMETPFVLRAETHSTPTSSQRQPLQGTASEQGAVVEIHSVMLIGVVAALSFDLQIASPATAQAAAARPPRQQQPVLV